LNVLRSNEWRGKVRTRVSVSSIGGEPDHAMEMRVEARAVGDGVVMREMREMVLRGYLGRLTCLYHGYREAKDEIGVAPC
jgi:hypothetical protein